MRERHDTTTKSRNRLHLKTDVFLVFRRIFHRTFFYPPFGKLECKHTYIFTHTHAHDQMNEKLKLRDISIKCVRIFRLESFLEYI